MSHTFLDRMLDFYCTAVEAYMYIYNELNKLLHNPEKMGYKYFKLMNSEKRGVGGRPYSDLEQ